MQRNYGRGQWHDRKPVVSINLKWFCDIHVHVAIRKTDFKKLPYTSFISNINYTF